VDNVRRVRPVPADRLKALTTERLLAYRARLLRLEQSASNSDWDDHELARLAPGFIYFKDDPRWEALYASIKAILADREHVDRTVGRSPRRGTGRRSRRDRGMRPAT
jgi:hypothetical protein